MDDRTNSIIGTASIFDNGLLLFHQVMDDDLNNLEAYAKTRTPVTHNDFGEFARRTVCPAKSF